MTSWKSLFTVAVLVSCACKSGRTQSGASPQLWYYHHSYLNSATAVASSKALIDQAAAAGYTGLALWDSGINFLQNSSWNPSYMSQVIQYAQSKGLAVMPVVAPYGHSYDMLLQNPNWAEGEQVVGTQFRVDSTGRTLQLVNSFPGLANGGFESGQTGWFSYEDPGVGLDNTVSHSGSASALIANAPANARISQNFAVQPWRQYHMRMFYKTQNFQGYSQMEIFADNNYALNRVNQPFSLAANQGWTQWDYTFNSGPHTSMTILTGVWGGSRGNYWIDDISLEETGLVYVLRGASTPLGVYDPNNPAHVYQENTDFGAISDTQFAGSPPYFQDNWHQPMVVPIPAGSSLRPNQLVAMNWYAIQPVYGDAGASLTDPGPAQWRTQNAAAVGTIFPNAAGFFFGYDEMRNMDSTASAKALNMTPAQLLDWHFNQTYSVFRALKPQAPIYVWGDMFDPNMNAVNNYYVVEGDLTGSWTGLPADVIVMNWNLGALNTSAAWFAGKNPQWPVAHQQVIAGYYDSGNGGMAATSELAQVSGIPGVVGLMYTTFSDDYSQLAAFAGAVHAGWSTYLASLPATTSPSVTSFNVLFGSERYNLMGSARIRLPWQISGIQVTFSEPITAGNVNSLAGIPATGFTGLGTNTLTWTINPIALGSYTASLAGSGVNALTDASGHGLGNGAGFSQALKVLWGDYNDDGGVNSQDQVLVNTATHNPYNILADMNGDGVVNVSDVLVVRARIGTSQQ
jgi:hypothetical protein